MGIDEQIAQAIFESHSNDLLAIRKYIAWVKFRRTVHHAFYKPPHWVSPVLLAKPKQTAHWVGRRL
jgi:hypothetical protein